MAPMPPPGMRGPHRKLVEQNARYRELYEA